MKLYTRDGQGKESPIGTSGSGGSGINNIVEGYRNDIDGLFYEDNTYTTSIDGAVNTEYIDLPNNKTYRWNGTAFVRLDNETVDIATSTTVGIVKPDNLTTYIDSNGTLHSKVWAGTLAEYYMVKDNIPFNTEIILTDYDSIPPDTTPVKIVTWADGTDEEIATMVAAADAGNIDLYNYWHVGDERVVHLSSMTAGDGLYVAQPEQDVVLVLMNKGYSGNPNVNFVWGQKDCLSQLGRMNTTNTNTGSWNGCAMRADLNSKYYNALPVTFRSCLKQFNVITAESYDGNTNQTSQDYISLFANKEVHGTDCYFSSSTENNALSQIEYYKTESNRIKKRNSSAYSWWKRSLVKDDPNDFCATSSYDGSEGTSMANGNIGIAPFGCI